MLDYSQGLKFSDHRALFVDLNEDILLSGKGTDPTHRRLRGLRLSNKNLVLQYNKLLREKLDAHNILLRCRKIRDLAKQNGRDAARHQLESIDQQVTAAALKAEKQSSRKDFGFPWSPTLAEAGQRVTFWRNCTRLIKSGIDPAAMLIPSQITQQKPFKCGLNVKYYQVQLDNAWTTLHMTQEKSLELRQQFLEESISKEADGKGNRPREVKLKAILRAEYLQKLWPKLRKYAKGQIRSSLSRIEVPIRDEDGEIIDWQSVTAQDEVCSEVIKRNIIHFSQAKNTPFVNGSFGNHLHPFGQNAFSESILQGKVDLDSFNVTEAIKACVKEMTFATGEDGIDTLDSTISAIDFLSGFKTISEKLTSSPSGRHYGHYKAVLQDPELCEMYATIMSVPFELWFGLQRWEQVYQTMLEKVKGVPRIDKLRVIQIIEADLNMSLRIIFGRRLVQRAESKGNLPNAQWGSRPNRSSTDCVFLKRLTFDGLKVLKQAAIAFNNDAKAAVDQMVPSVGGIALCCLGASKNAVGALLKILEKMRYKVRTGLGLSEEEFSNVNDWVLGTLQGSGAPLFVVSNYLPPPWGTNKEGLGNKAQKSTRNPRTDSHG
jgi:hypothetical protein